jgi:hypothetical protein
MKLQAAGGLRLNGPGDSKPLPRRETKANAGGTGIGLGGKNARTHVGAGPAYCLTGRVSFGGWLALR